MKNSQGVNNNNNNNTRNNEIMLSLEENQLFLIKKMIGVYWLMGTTMYVCMYVCIKKTQTCVPKFEKSDLSNADGKIDRHLTKKIHQMLK